MKQKILVSVAIAITFGASFILTPITSAIARADDETSNNETSGGSGRETRIQTTTANREEAKAKLSEAKLAICKKHETSINNVISRVSDRDQKRMTLFSATSEEIQAFYEKNKLSVANFDSLLSKVAEKKSAAQMAIDTTKNAAVTFSCEAGDPKGVVSSFKNSHSSSIVALKEYKEAVKSLLTAVKAAAEQKKASSNGGAL